MKRVTKEYDIAIIGAGSAGLTAAAFAVQIGARVVLADKQRTGGDCTWSGCVPSKTLLKTAKVAQEIRSASRYGLEASKPVVDLKTVMAHVRTVVDEIAQEESPEALQAQGIDVFLGGARFLDANTLSVGEAMLSARHILICTGARPSIPPIAGLADIPFLTYETVWGMGALPHRLLVVGAGPIGCEMAQAFRRLGAEVILLASHDVLLPRDEPAASRVLGKVLAAEGIDIRYQVRAERVWQDAQGIHVVAGGAECRGDALLLATGRQPVVEGLDLEKAGVAYSTKGIQVNKYLRTNKRHIYAAGDCTGGPQFTHYAGRQAFMAVRNALIPGVSRGIVDHVPWTTFTDPEVAHVGLGEAQARAMYGDDVQTCNWPMAKVDRARAEGATAGFLRLVHRKDGTLLGATIVAAHAGEMISEWIVGLERGLKVGEIGNTIHVYPTYSTASSQATAAISVQRLLSGSSGKIIRSVVHLMR
ncbi:MAG: FAD-binding protein [Lysobacterales bacterium]|nr:MAG: FAD-binding protein [Xanthomonadales bacterium]